MASTTRAKTPHHSWATRATIPLAGALAAATTLSFTACQPAPQQNQTQHHADGQPSSNANNNDNDTSRTNPLAAAADAFYDTVIKPFAEPSRDKLLPDLPPPPANTTAATHARPTLVLSLDGCLLESLYTRQHGWRYAKRPGLDAFLEQLAPFYELVLWTDAMNTADAVVDQFDPRRRIKHRLYRDTTTYRNGHHRKDLDALNRDTTRVLIIDTDAKAFAMHPRNGIVVKKYVSADDPEKKDTALLSLVPFLQYLALSGAANLADELEPYQKAEGGIGAEFERRLPALRASGKLKLPSRRGGGGASAGPPRGTIWERLRSRDK